MLMKPDAGLTRLLGRSDCVITTRPDLFLET
jgi:hypothetical protein